MKTLVRTIGLLILAGIIAMPAAAAELRVTGFFDTAISTEQNISGNPADFDVTNNKDKATWASTLSRLFFNFIASDDLRGIFAIELDAAWGAPARDRLDSQGVTLEQRGFRNAIDINNFELKQLYVDFRIPQLPIGNRWRVGGPRFQATPLHTNLLVNVDAGGADVNLTLSPEVSLLLYYVQMEEDVERFPGSIKIGEDYLTGATLMLKPLPGLDLHFPILYEHLQAPFGSIAGGLGTPFSGGSLRLTTTNVATEDRLYLGFDTRYRLGNLSIEPSFLYLTGTRKFCTTGQLTGHGTSGAVSNVIGGTATTATTACTSAPLPPLGTGVREIDINAFAGMLELNYTIGKWLLSVQGVYSSGDKATTDRNNHGLTQGRTRGDIHLFQTAGSELAHWTKWLSILGTSEGGHTRQDQSPWRLGEGSALGLDRFGRVSGAGKVEYILTDSLIVRGTLGAVWSAETPACPAVQRTGTVTATNPTGCADLQRNWTGNSKYLGTEVDVFLDWTILPGLLNRIGGAYGFLGDGLQTNHGKVQN
ncbi:MAG: hypothetical protein HYZ81_11900, partial [Nitrospinae bacterium]|nr:hypothetical protein [Nitrospinota bacterium]